MSSVRSEISKKNPYWIPKHRYLELHNFCLQYPDWKYEFEHMNTFKEEHGIHKSIKDYIFSITEDRAIQLMAFYDRMKLIEDTARETDPELCFYILEGITRSLSYEFLHLQLGMPCGRDTYYDRYRKFFWLLDKKRN